MIKLAVIGFGSRISAVIAGFRHMNNTVRVMGIMDPDEKGATERLHDRDKEDVRFYKSLDKMIREVKPDALVIGTQCNLHSKFAIQAAKYDLPLYLEKPVAIDMKSARALEKAFEKSKCEVVVSFPLRVSPIAIKTKELIDSNELDPQHIMAYNYVPYGRGYWEHFYRDYTISGGLFLQKATHDLDYITFLMGKKITRISAMGTFNLFKGKKRAGLTCAKCKEVESCLESPLNRRMGDYGGGHDHKCFFSKDLNDPETANEDSSSCLMQFEDGSHGTYNQVFYSLRDTGMRGSRISSYKGTIEFNWYKNKIHLMKHFDSFKADYSPQGKDAGHFGGDHALSWDFVNLIQGISKSRTPIETGIQSAYNCLAARESMHSGKLVNVRQVGQVK
ncbi:MAG: Gfo/Idh/MocA family oxidoreductase [Lentisphaeria bacterium]|nr:Gfo/Idh/MocA family oxidoreductase [Lentisphaeria bacterium]NQZ67935.1 Gfo/Idh/MocA family oxidoreductase [Lentisphaeria bacterium]